MIGDDGIGDMWDPKGQRESQRRYEDEHATAARSHSSYDVTAAPGTVLLVGLVTADNPVAPINVEIVNALGQVVASSPTLPGASVVTYVPLAGGTYAVRARNNGFTPVRFSTTIITREAWLF